MRRFFRSTLVSGFALAAVVSVGIAESKAAAAAPVLSVVSGKMAEGEAYTDGGTVFAADGINIYSAYRTSGNAIKLVMSKNGGAKWGGAHAIYTIPAEQQAVGSTLDKVSTAVSGDEVFPTQKIVHVVWELQSPNGDGGFRDIYYAWADAADLNSWSAPVRLNGSMPYLEDPTIAVTKTGKVFVKGEADRGLYLMTAESHEAGMFSEPALIPVSSTGPVAGDAEIFVDKTNNLHLSYPYCSDIDCTLAGIKYTKLPAGSSTWSTPTTVLVPSVGGANHTGLTAYDSNNIYIATKKDDNLTFFSTINGGSSWTKKTVFTKTSTLRTVGYVDVTVNASKAITVGAPFEKIASDGSSLGREARIYRSTDGGASWSTPTAITGTEGFISLGVDGNGKVGILTPGEYDGGEAVTYFSKEK